MDERQSVTDSAGGFEADCTSAFASSIISFIEGASDSAPSDLLPSSGISFPPIPPDTCTNEHGKEWCFDCKNACKHYRTHQPPGPCLLPSTAATSVVDRRDDFGRSSSIRKPPLRFHLTALSVVLLVSGLLFCSSLHENGFYTLAHSAHHSSHDSQHTRACTPHTFAQLSLYPL